MINEDQEKLIVKSLSLIVEICLREKLRLAPAGLDGHLNAIMGLLLEIERKCGVKIWEEENFKPIDVPPHKRKKLFPEIRRYVDEFHIF